MMTASGGAGDRFLWLPQQRYDRSERLITESLQTLARGGSTPLMLLEVGPGPHSVLLSALEGPDAVMPAHVDFVEKAAVEEVRGRGSLTCDVRTATTGTFPDRPVSWAFHRADFNAFLSAASSGVLSAERYHLMVLHAVVHELYRDADGATPATFFTNLFERLAWALKPGGLLLVADPYYPSYSEPLTLVAALFKEVEHADPPVCFLHPEQILGYAVRPGEPAGRQVERDFTLRVEESSYAPVPGTGSGRKFYVFLLERAGEVAPCST